MGFTALAWACSEAHSGVVRQLIEAGADIGIPSSLVRMPPLIAAASNGHLEVVELLIKSGVDIHAQTDVDENALTIARQRRQHEVVKLLMENGARELTPKPTQPIDLKAIHADANLSAAKSALYAFVEAWSAWERSVAKDPDRFNNRALVDLNAENIGRFCTPRKRAYVAGLPSFSPNITYAEVNDSTLINCEPVGSSRVHLDFKGRHIVSTICHRQEEIRLVAGRH